MLERPANRDTQALLSRVNDLLQPVVVVEDTAELYNGTLAYMALLQIYPLD